MGTEVFDISSKYNFSDLTRVNTNIQYLLDTLLSFGYSPVLSNPVVTSYTRVGFPYVADINNTRQNILDLITGFYSLSAPAVVVDIARKQLFGFNEANALELNLSALDTLLDNLVSYFKYAGTFYCGEERNYL